MILGAGGHGQVVADILQQMRELGSDVVPLGYLDDNSHLHGQNVLGLPVLGKIDNLYSFDYDAVVIGIGTNQIRQNLFAHLEASNKTFVVARHPGAIIAPSASLGHGSVICAGAVVNPGSAVGANVILNTGCTVDHHNRIGNHAHIAPGVHLGGDVQIGTGTLVGIGSTVIPQRTIGRWSVIGAGSVVTKNIPDYTLATGLPARVIRKLY